MDEAYPLTPTSPPPPTPLFLLYSHPASHQGAALGRGGPSYQKNGRVRDISPPYSLGCVRPCVRNNTVSNNNRNSPGCHDFIFVKQHQKTGNQPPTGRSLGDVVDKMLDGSGAAAAARTWLAQRRAAATAANGRLQSACGVRASAPIPHSWVDFVFSLAKSRRRTRCHRCALLPRPLPRARTALSCPLSLLTPPLPPLPCTH